MSTELEAAIRKELRKNHVTFAELSRIEGFEGNFEITFPKHNMVLWSGISEEALTILDRLRKAGEFHYWPTDILPYLIDGVSLTYPVAKKAQRYAKPHWLPVVLKLGPDPDAVEAEAEATKVRSGTITRRFGGANAEAAE